MDFSLGDNPHCFGSAFNNASVGYTPNQSIWGAEREGSSDIFQASEYHSPSGEMRSANACMASGTSSFVRIHQEITDGGAYLASTSWEETPEMAYARAQGRPGTTPVGQYTPIGDGVLPMLVMAAIVAVVCKLRLRNKES